jgi:uncharacterized protein YkwD
MVGLRHLTILAALLVWPGAAAAQSCTLGDPAALRAVHDRVNAARRQHGLGAVALSPVLGRAAAGHACDMIQRGFFSHQGSNSSSARARAQRAGYRSCLTAENIAWGQPTPGAVFDAWMRSPGHRANILRPGLRDVGLAQAVPRRGQSGPRWVMVLARPC